MAIPPAAGRPKCVVVQPHGWDARILHRYGVRIFCREFSLSAGRHSLAVAFGNRHSRNFSLDWILPQEIHSQPKQGCCDRGLEKCWRSKLQLIHRDWLTRKKLCRTRTQMATICPPFYTCSPSVCEFCIISSLSANRDE